MKKGCEKHFCFKSYLNFNTCSESDHFCSILTDLMKSLKNSADVSSNVLSFMPPRYKPDRGFHTASVSEGRSFSKNTEIRKKYRFL